MKKNRLMRLAMRATFVLMVPGIMFAASCSREEPPKPRAVEAVNPYSADSVYQELQKKLKDNPNDADALYHLADLYDRNAQYSEAIETYKKVVTLRPDMGYAYFKMGTAYDRLDKAAEAVAEFRKAARHLPNHPVLYNNMGIAYGKLGKSRDEIQSLKKAIQLRPTYSAARYNLGMTYLRIGDRKAAMKEYEALDRFDSGTAAALKKEIDKAS